MLFHLSDTEFQVAMDEANRMYQLLFLGQGGTLPSRCAPGVEQEQASGTKGRVMSVAAYGPVGHRVLLPSEPQSPSSFLILPPRSRATIRSMLFY